MSRSHKHVFTINNYTEEDVKAVRSFALESDYLIYGFEKGESGTPHLQGFVHHGSNKKTLNAVVQALGGRAHVEVARGSSTQASDYCKKEGSYVEHGVCPQDRQKNLLTRADYATALRLAESGRSREIDPVLLTRFYGTYKQVRRDYLQQEGRDRLGEPCGVWYWGVAGAGKSWKAREEFPNAYTKGVNKWWDGYVDQESVIMDEVNPDSAKALTTHLKIWTDIYPFNAEIKGGTMYIRPKHFVVTSNYSLEACFGPDDLDAMLRRFKVTYFEFPYTK